MKKSKRFAAYAVVGTVAVIICGADSIFENPLGLIAFSAIFGTAIAALVVGIETLAEKIDPKETKKFVEKWMQPSEE